MELKKTSHLIIYFCIIMSGDPVKYFTNLFWIVLYK